MCVENQISYELHVLKLLLVTFNFSACIEMPDKDFRSYLLKYGLREEQNKGKQGDLLFSMTVCK